MCETPNILWNACITRATIKIDVKIQRILCAIIKKNNNKNWTDL